MSRLIPVSLIVFGSSFLFWNLGRPALWQDEAETALRAESILESGLPRMTLGGTLVTAQPSLVAHEARPSGVWTWDTWLPAYLVAASFTAFGRTPWAARLPFALAAILSLWLIFSLSQECEKDNPTVGRATPEVSLALLALSPAFLLFCRQSRYYALVALGTVLVLVSWRRLLADKPWSALATALSLQFLLHSCFAFFVVACLALALDAGLRSKECLSGFRFWRATVLTVALAAPAVWYFRMWDRPGNHAYGFAESLEFLKTFLLWLLAFCVPLALVLASFARRLLMAVCGAVLACGLVAEGFWSLACAVLLWAGLLAAAVRMPAIPRVMNLRRLCLLWLCATLGLLAFGAAEPYGRYLAGALPAVSYLVACELSSLGQGRSAIAAILVLISVSSNFLSWAPLKIAEALVAPRAPRDSVSGMMRQRLRDIGLGSDLARFSEEIARGPEGYVEIAAAAMRESGGATFFSDSDSLSLMFATGFRPIYPDELRSVEPDWILPSVWLSLAPELAARISQLVASGRYERIELKAPSRLWQNNPDPLVHDFSAKMGSLVLFRRVRF